MARLSTVAAAVFRAYVGLELGVAAARTVPRRLKELASLRAAALIGCPLCLDLGSAEARAAGVSEAELRVDSQGFSAGAYCVRAAARP
jgi:AhpD family alkylhydroperoxidase